MEALKDLEGYEEMVERIISVLPPEEVMRHYKPEERLAGLKPEERIAGLTAEERAALRRYLDETSS